MAYPAEARTTLRAAYVDERRAIEDAAARAAVPLGTAQRWKREARQDGDDWDKCRAAAQLAGDSRGLLVQTLLEDYIQLHQTTQRALGSEIENDPLKAAEALSRLADAFTKVMAAVGKASPELSALALMADFIAELIRFTNNHHPAESAALLTVLEPFGDHLAKKYA